MIPIKITPKFGKTSVFKPTLKANKVIPTFGKPEKFKPTLKIGIK